MKEVFGEDNGGGEERLSVMVRPAGGRGVEVEAIFEV